MSAPIITWNLVTDSSGSPSKSALSVLNYGNVQTGSFASAKVITATFGGNSAHGLMFWLNTTTSTGSNSNVSSSAGWIHNHIINNAWYNPASITSDMMAGTVDVPFASNGANGTKRFAVLPETQPSSSNFKTTTVSSNSDTDYIYLTFQPIVTANDGVTSGWGYRMSFLYP